jgi:lysophospholipase L1-like esterase
MKTILCYGDSNTWGFDPASGERFSPDVRWTGVLARELGEGYRVIEEGLNGRTTVWDDPVEGVYRNGKTYLLPCLESHRPLDLVILMLGTNDLKRRFSVSALDIANSAGSLVEVIQRSACGPGRGAPAVLLVAPPPTGQLSAFAEMFADEGEKSRKFSSYYRQAAGLYGCSFLDGGEYVTSSDLDGIHFEPEGHLNLGRAAAGCARQILQGS